MDMLSWLASIKASPRRGALPILSYPAIQMMGISVNELVSNSDNQATAMQLIAERTDSLASVSLMDLSVEAECFGSNIRFSDDEVPTVTGSIISSSQDADRLAVPEIGAGRTGIYIDAVKKAAGLIKDRPVFAGVIGPFSLAGRLLDVSKAMIYCYEQPDTIHLLLNKVTAFSIAYCRAYKKAGASGVIMAEPLAGLMSRKLADPFSSAYIKKIVAAVQDREFIVIYHNCGNSTVKIIDSILSTGASLYSFGNAVQMSEVMQHIPSHTIAMGNIDPAGQFSNGTPESVRKSTLKVLDECGKYPNYVVSSGCDIPPLSKWDNIDAFFEAVREFDCNAQAI
ncbi:MAG: uroporphyrinogen decarboxylase family protein [Dehalococcoidia bacterium]